MKLQTRFFTLLAVVLFSTVAFSQEDESEEEDNKTEISYGDTDQDSIKCVQYLSLYSEFYKQGNYADAIGPWRQALAQCPKSSKNLYIRGNKMIDKLIEDTKDEALKEKYIDTLFWLYDKRIEAFNEEGKVLDRKGVDMVKLRKEKPVEAYETLKKAHELLGNELSPGGVLYYYQAAYLSVKEKVVTKTQLLELYPALSDICNHNIAKDNAKKNYEAAQNNIDKIFVAIASCEDIEEVFQPKYDANPTDPNLMRAIVSAMTKKECTESDLFFVALKGMVESDPSFQGMFAYAQRLTKQNKCGDAIEYYKKAAELSETDEQKIDAYMSAAKCYFNIGSFSSVRTYAQKALGVNPNYGEAYLLIGDAYAAGSKGIGDNACTSKGGYWAAVDKYSKAKAVDGSVAGKANSKISRAKGQFPTVQDCFNVGKKAGDAHTVGGWIDEQTVISTK